MIKQAATPNTNQIISTSLHCWLLSDNCLIDIDKQLGTCMYFMLSCKKKDFEFKVILTKVQGQCSSNCN